MTHPDQPGTWSDPLRPTPLQDPNSPTVPVPGQGFAPSEPATLGQTQPQASPDQAYAPPEPPYQSQPYQSQPYQGQSHPDQPYSAPVYPEPAYADSGYAAGPAGYTAPGYPPYGYGAPAAPTTNALAITSLVLSLVGLVTCGVTGLIGAILGHVAKRQIRERREGGEGMATAGIIVGWIVFVLMALMFIGYIVFMVWLVENAPDLAEPTPTFG
ncbi:MAG TPA: DUF4190 domain-containing protein [Micromonosporaceae bacterium]|nr:DUF4190 domain-containing protein [Micromonosporaceae bacterium]